VRRDNAHAPVLILKDDNKQLLPYGEAPHADSIAAVRSYNAFIAAQDLKLELSNPEWEQVKAELASEATRTGRRRPLPEMSNTFLYRVFNNADWQQGGRFFGGWWQSVPSAWRERITIGGETTTELDFSGFLTRAIYHNEEHDYQEDPYDIPEIRHAAQKENREWETVRPGVKLAMNVLINSSPEDNILKVQGFFFPKKITRSVAYDLLKARHPAIRHKFQRGEGLRVMRQESDICAGILAEAMAAGIPVLPVHDSFVVQRRNRQWLRDAMMLNYRRHFLFNPVVKEKLPNGGQD
jgi:hypothetical protein